MAEIPRDRAVDSTLAFWREGYAFISNRCNSMNTDLFEARLLLQPTICMRGRDAATLFYDVERFSRHGAVPPLVRKTLFGEGGVQGLDGEAHRVRKAMFMSLVEPDAVAELAELVGALWRDQIRRWEKAGRMIVLDAASRVLTRAVCAWSGVPLPENEVAARTAELRAMVDLAAAVGLGLWRARQARSRSEQWIGELIERVRAGTLPVERDRPLAVIANYREVGAPLPANIAAVELINVLRPTMAVARFIAFAALAMHEHPEWRARLRDGTDEERELFVQEVRRFYPFSPAVAARVRETFDWHGYRFPARCRVLLDLYGTDHDPRLWPEPEQFRPERFRGWGGDAFNFIPQGGGDHHKNHRCPGEDIAIAVLKVLTRELAGAMDYQVPPQDLQVRLSRLPAQPESGVLLTDIRELRNQPIGSSSAA
jgi:fatty-acid peroxygenase